MIVTFRHMRSVPGFSKTPGFCSRGGRAWFAAHNLDWTDFVKHGIDEETLLATGDAFAIATVQWAHECATREVC